MTAPFPIWVLKNGILHRRTNADSGSARCGRLAAAPSMTSGLSAAMIMAAARSMAAAGATGSSTTCGGIDVGRGFVGRDILGQFEMHGPRPLLLRDPERVANQGRNALRGRRSASPSW